MPPKAPLKICLATAEMAPLAKTGGLADVTAALTAYFARSGHEVRALLPLYGAVGGAPPETSAILTLPGLPVIYAGDEVGQSQSSSLPDDADHADRWFREPMPWDTDDWDHAVHDRIAALARLRTTTPALHDDAGYRELVGAGPVWVYERRSADGSDRLLVALNTSDEAATLTLAELGVTASSAPGVDDTGDSSGVGRPLTDADVEVVHGSPTSLGDGPGVPVGLGALEVLVLRLPVG